MRTALTRLAVLGLTAMAAFPASAAPMAAPVETRDSNIVLVAQGCGPGWWRGPWGHCRDTPFTGRMPGAVGPTTIRRPTAISAMAALPAIGAAPGVTAATRRITAVSPAAVGNSAMHRPTTISTDRATS